MRKAIILLTIIFISVSCVTRWRDGKLFVGDSILNHINLVGVFANYSSLTLKSVDVKRQTITIGSLSLPFFVIPLTDNLFYYNIRKGGTIILNPGTPFVSTIQFEIVDFDEGSITLNRLTW